MEVGQQPCGYVQSRVGLPIRQELEGYSCPKLAWAGEEYCIFHIPNPDKDHRMFSEQLVYQLNQCYIGFVFPRKFTLFSFDFQDADFAFSTFYERADFQGKTFSGRSNFQYATFHGAADFSGASFEADVSFVGSEFNGTAWFNRAALDGCVSLISTHFKGEFWFADISNAAIDMTGAILEKDTHFHNTVFSAGSFIETQFKGPTTLGFFKHMLQCPTEEIVKKAPNIVFFEGVDMKHMLFRESNLNNASFHQCYNLDEARLYDCKWNSDSGRNHVLYDELELRGKVPPWEVLANNAIKGSKGFSSTNAASDCMNSEQKTDSLLGGKYVSVEETCRAFKKHFEDRRNYLTAGDFHEGEMEMRRLAKGTWGRNILSIEAVYWLLSRYGQRWVRPLVCFIVFNLMAAFVYSLTGLQLGNESTPIKLGQDAIFAPTLWLDSIYIYLHSLLYSISVSALLRGVYGSPTHIVGHILQTIQFIVGPLLIFLIGLAIRRRVRR